EIAPGRLAVQHQYRIAHAVLDVGHLQAFHFHIFRRVRKVRQILKALLWRAQHGALWPCASYASKLGYFRDVGGIQAVGDFSNPYREREQVSVKLMLGRSRFVAVPMAVEYRHNGTATPGVQQFEAVEMVMHRAPIDAPGADSGGALDRFGDV